MLILQECVNFITLEVQNKILLCRWIFRFTSEIERFRNCKFSKNPNYYTNCAVDQEFRLEAEHLEIPEIEDEGPSEILWYNFCIGKRQ